MASDQSTPAEGDILFLSDTHLLVIAKPTLVVHRDAKFWRIRVRVQDGEWKGQELWMIADHSYGPWETPGVGFV